MDANGHISPIITDPDMAPVDVPAPLQTPLISGTMLTVIVALIVIIIVAIVAYMWITYGKSEKTEPVEPERLKGKPKPTKYEPEKVGSEPTNSEVGEDAKALEETRNRIKELRQIRDQQKQRGSEDEPQFGGSVTADDLATMPPENNTKKDESGDAKNNSAENRLADDIVNDAEDL